MMLFEPIKDHTNLENKIRLIIRIQEMENQS
jgi:hypothetical protein